MTETLFRFKNVTLAGRLFDLTLTIDAQCLTMITGPSGAGKSSLLRLCNGLEVPDGGSIEFRGAPLAKRLPRQHRRDVALVFQQPLVFAGTVGDNIAEADPSASTEDLLQRAGLDSSFIDRDADLLSGGEKQRVAVARALGTDPTVLLLDEATSALDEDSSAVIEQGARTFVEAGGSVVWVSHDAAQIARLADKVLHIAGGRVAQ
ncbi:MAG: ATP-binding cassette domain-containing protein [Acidimicrobiales bacterium]